MFVVIVVPRTVCRRIEAFAARGGPIMKNSSERDPSPHSANKSRWLLTIMVVSALIVSVVLSVSWRNNRTMSGWKRYQSEIAARGIARLERLHSAPGSAR